MPHHGNEAGSNFHASGDTLNVRAPAPKLEAARRQSLVRRFRSSLLLQNVAALYWIQLATYALPIVTIPYLTRVLGRTAWGLLVFAQVFGFYLAFLVEYGFGLSGTRELARRRDDPSARTELLTDVTWTRVLLSLVVLVIALATRRYVDKLSSNADLFWAMTIFAIAQGNSMSWFFQGVERMKLIAAIEVGTRVVANVTIFWVVHRPSDAWAVLALQAGGAAAGSLIGFLLAAKGTPLGRPRPARIKRMLVCGSGAFVQRGLTSLQASQTILIVGLLLPAATVGIYEAADSLTKTVVLCFITPVMQAVYPRLSYLLAHDETGAPKLAKRTVLVGVAIAAAWTFITLTAADVLTRIVFGSGFVAAAGLARVLSLSLPLGAASALAMMWFLASRAERFVNNVLTFSSLAMAVLAIGAARLGGPAAVAWSVVLVQVATGGLLWARVRQPARSDIKSLDVHLGKHR